MVAAGLTACGGDSGGDSGVGDIGNAPAVNTAAAAPALPNRSAGTRAPGSELLLPNGPADATAAPQAAPAMPLQAWLRQWAQQRGATAEVAPALMDRTVTVRVEAATGTEALVAAIGGPADVVLSYTARAGAPAVLAAVAVHALGERPRDRALAGREGATSPQDAELADPALKLAQLTHDLASPDEPARRQALVRSFEIDTPLPLQALLSAAQGDRSGTVRRYALMAIERHPDADAPFLRTLVHRARADADPEVRRQADELEERLDADDPSAEAAPGS